MILKNITICVLLLLILFISSSCNVDLNSCNADTKKSQENYKANLDEVLQAIAGELYVCNGFCNVYSEIWSKAINDDEDFSKVLSKARDRAEEGGFIKTLQDKKNKIKFLMKELKDPPDEYKESYNVLLDLYTEYTHLESLAEEPSGSLISYNNDVNESINKCQQLMEKIKVLKP